MNAKTHLLLSIPLSMKENEIVEDNLTAKKVWDTLQTHHDGSDREIVLFLN
jgi:hypothetical protein